MAYLNTMIVFIVSGIWHGAGWSFILCVWGGGHGLLSVFDRIFEREENKILRPARWLITFLWVNVLWLLFGLHSSEYWIHMLRNMISFGSMELSSDLLKIFVIQEAGLIMDAMHLVFHIEIYAYSGLWMILFIVAAFGICLLTENNYRRMTKISRKNMVFAAIALVWGILCLSTNTTFIYSGF